MIRVRLFFIALVLIFTQLLSAQQVSKNQSQVNQVERSQPTMSQFDIENERNKKETDERCQTAGLPHIPPSDLPSQQEKNELRDKDCDVFRLGIGVEKNLVKYRKCLLSQKEMENVSLAEIYANGWGVTRNSNLALALICHKEELAPAESYDMVKFLYETRNLQKLPKEFIFCEHITSGFNLNFCAARYAKITDAKRTVALQQIVSKWPEAHRLAFQKLLKAADEFFELHSTSELDMSGTARGMIAINEKSALFDKFLNSLKMFEEGKLPSDNDFKQADNELNKIYTKLLNTKFSDQTGTLTKEGFINTERKWLAYRDAWVNFGVLHYPNTTAIVWKTWVTEERAQQLKGILESI